MCEWIEYEKNECVNEYNMKRMNVRLNRIWKGWMCELIEYEKERMNVWMNRIWKGRMS